MVSSRLSLRPMIIGGLAAIVGRIFVPFLFPHGFPANTDNSLVYKVIDPSSDLLRQRHGNLVKIYEQVGLKSEETGVARLDGPETVLVNPANGRVYVMTVNGELLEMVMEPDSKDASEEKYVAKFELVKDLGSGRPLGGRFTPDGETLYIADAIQGLTRLRNPGDPASKVELVASKITPSMSKGTPSAINLANDLAISAKTGKVYFTDSNDIPVDRFRLPSHGSSKMTDKSHKTIQWDTLYNSKVDLMRGKPTGRLLEYDPTTDQVRVLATGFHYANGIAIDPRGSRGGKEEYLIVADTFAPRILKYHLEGNKQGKLEELVSSQDFTGYPDGVDCAVKSGSAVTCFAAMPSSIVPLHRLWSRLPHSRLAQLLRAMLMMLPRTMSPKIKPYGGIIEFDPQSDDTKVRYLQDPDGQDIGIITGATFATEADGDKLYLGSLHNPFIGIYRLQ